MTITRRLKGSCAILLVFFISSTALSEEGKLDERWKMSFQEGLGAFDTGDVDYDKNDEIVVADSNNTLYIIDANGTVKQKFRLPPKDEIGSAYALRIVDLDRDSSPEILVGFGGKRESVNHTWDEYFNAENVSIGRKTSFLYRRNSNAGGAMLLNASGATIWVRPYILSVNDVKAYDLDYDGKKEVLIGTGSYMKEEYWEFKGYNEEGKELWNLTEYNFWNASLSVLESDGDVMWSFDLTSDKPNKVRSVDAGDLIGDSKVEVLVASDDGMLYLLNDTGFVNATYNATNGIYAMIIQDISSTRRKDVILGVGDNTIHAIDSNFNIIWRYKLQSIPQGIYAKDLEGDDREDIFVGGRDAYVYLLYDNGALRWKHFTGEPVYHIKAEDLDRDEFIEVITASNENITVFNLNKHYIMKEKGNTYYDKAYERYQVGDYVLSRIYAQKAREFFLDSNDLTTLPKVDLLLDQIKEALKSVRKTEADFNYGRALELYGKNKYDESETYLLKAKVIYLELNDSVGADKTDLLLRQIEDEIRLKKILKADSLYADALSYFGFRNFTAAKQYAEEAKAIYAEVQDEKNVMKADGFVLRIGDEYYDSARRSLIGLDAEKAREYAGNAKAIYFEYNNTKGLEKTLTLEVEIKNFSERKLNPIYSIIGRVLPYVLFILIIILAYSLIIKRKAKASVTKEKNISESIQQELEKMV